MMCSMIVPESTKCGINLININVFFGKVRIFTFKKIQEDVHDKKKWRENVMKRKSNPIGKWTINNIIIYIYLGLVYFFPIHKSVI